MAASVSLSAIAVLLISSVAAAEPESAFSDVYASSNHVAAINWITENAIAKGYPDGSFRPDRRVNRAEAIKMIVLARNAHDDSCTDSIFADIPRSAWFVTYVCSAERLGWLDQRGDKPSFRPSDTINAGELSTLLARVYEFDVPEGEPWYAPSIRALASRHIIPPEIEASGQSVSRSQLAEMLWRLEQKPSNVSSANSDNLLSAQCDWQPARDITRVDDEEITRTWMNWVNGLRVERDLEPYAIDRHLMRTAQSWADHAQVSGAITHKRQGQSAYYDYNRMEEWFASLDLSFRNINRITFTENIGWGVYKCSKEDCTADLIKALRTTFDMYVAEKDKASKPHWNSMVNPEFRLAGVGMTVDETRGRYYFTAHYGTAITSDPDPVCP